MIKKIIIIILGVITFAIGLLGRKKKVIAMGNKLRYIDLGLIEPDFIPAVNEFSQLFNLENPVYFDFRVNKKALITGNSERLDKYIKVEEIPKEVRVVRNKIGGGGVLISDSSILFSFFHYYNVISLNEVKRALMVIGKKILKKYGIKVKKKNNDLFFRVDDKLKKFYGSLIFSHNDYICFSSLITLDFNSDCIETGRQIYKFDKDKFTKKGDFGDITNIVGGLHEVNKDIDFGIGFEIAQEVANRFNLQIEKSSLTEEELLKMNELNNKRNNKDWKLYAK